MDGFLEQWAEGFVVDSLNPDEEDDNVKEVIYDPSKRMLTVRLMGKDAAYNASIVRGLRKKVREAEFNPFRKIVAVGANKRIVRITFRVENSLKKIVDEHFSMEDGYDDIRRLELAIMDVRKKREKITGNN